jgi:hypothetical protein
VRFFSDDGRDQVVRASFRSTAADAKGLEMNNTLNRACRSL